MRNKKKKILDWWMNGTAGGVGDDWILNTGFWVDSGSWIDADVWID